MGKRWIVMARSRAAEAGARRFAGYELAELVGHDRMSEIYGARDLRLGREVAVRIVGPDIAGDPVVRARLNRASTALASVDHPNVVPIYETGEAEGRLFIVTRWVQGTSFSDLVREQGPLEPRRAVRIVNQVASALQAAHAVELMHRNVKPSSVLVTDTDHAYLTDFGLARRVSDLTGLTMQEHLLESFDYLAPEYIEGSPVDALVDIYGLGCVLYEALTGEVPYPEATPAAKMYAHRSADPPSIRARRPELPEELDAVVRRALAKNPADRPQSPSELAAEAAGALRMSAPPWSISSSAASDSARAIVYESDRARSRSDRARSASDQARSETNGARSDAREGEGAAQQEHVPSAAPQSAHAGSASMSDSGYYEPVYVQARRPAGPRVLLGLAVLVFLAAPIALLIALLAHA
jgi:serine/threonine protein kinase